MTRDELAAQAAKARAMVERWEAEDVSDEPEWDIEDIERLRFREIVVAPDDEPASSPAAVAPKPLAAQRPAGR